MRGIVLLVACAMLGVGGTVLGQEIADAIASDGTRDARAEAEAEFEEAASSRLDRIKSELASLDDHPWAGRYYCGDGLGSNNSLWLAPESGAYAVGSGCLGRYSINHGEVLRVSDDVIQIEWADPDEMFPGAGLVRVAWGERHYLYSTGWGWSERLLETIEDGSLSSNPMVVYLRHSDRDKPLTGRPHIPAFFLPEFPAPPLEATIDCVESFSEMPPLFGSGWFIGSMWVDAGRDHGIAAGMVFFPVSDGRVGLGVLKVAEVEDDRCRLSFTLRFEEGTSPPLPKLGDRVTTTPTMLQPRGHNSVPDAVDSDPQQSR